MMLVESSPNAILEKFQTESLEDAILNLSQLQENQLHINKDQVSNPQAESNEPLNTVCTSQNYPSKVLQLFRFIEN